MSLTVVISGALQSSMSGVGGCRAIRAIDALQEYCRGTLIPEAWGTAFSDGLLHSSEARALHHPGTFPCYNSRKMLCFNTQKFLLEHY